MNGNPTDYVVRVFGEYQLNKFGDFERTDRMDGWRYPVKKLPGLARLLYHATITNEQADAICKAVVAKIEKDLEGAVLYA